MAPAVVVLLATIGGGQVVHVGVRGGTRERAENSELQRLVNVDDELVGFLKQAEEFIEQQRYTEAVRALQALIERNDAGFVPGDEPGGYVSLQAKAQAIVGQLPPEAMEVYRRLYEPQAQRLFEQGADDGDEVVLRRVAEHYSHTSYGRAALDRLARIRFDRAEFGDSAGLWERKLELSTDDAERPLLLAKLAVANHLAGSADASERFAVRLRTNYPDAEADLAGKQEKLVNFVERIRAQSPPMTAASESKPAASNTCEVEFRWREPGAGGPDEPFARLIAGHTYDDEDDSSPPPIHTSVRAAFEGDAQRLYRLKRGHVQLFRPRLAGFAEWPMPALLKPIIADGRVVYRTDNAVESRDMLTGALMWRSDELPLARTVSRRRYYHRRERTVNIPAERGRHALTVSDGKVFALAGFVSPLGQAHGRWGMSDDQQSDPRGSSLVALSMKRSGELLWRIGGEDETDEFLRECMFISAPTVSDGRAYIIAVAHDRYHVLCLDADDGSLLFSSAVSQRPVVGTEGDDELSRYLLETGSPPTVAGGWVYVCTNAGVVAAVDADTGRGLWARRYRSRFDSHSLGFELGGLRNASLPAANAVVVAGGRVISLPSDSSDVLAFSADGELLWQRSREGLVHLTAIDESRMLLSGPGLSVVSAADGSALPGEISEYGSVITDIRGRPAVAGDVVYASGAGRIYRLDLRDYSADSVKLPDEQCLLGNLVLAGEQLIAGNGAGVAAYFSYESARSRLTQRLRKAQSVNRPELLVQRARFALEAGRGEDALADLLACRDELAADDTAAGEQVRTLLRRTYVALGNRAEDPGEMIRRFEQAMEVSDGDAEKVETMLRLAKARELAGHFSTAADIAQQISDSYGELKVSDVPVGPDADDSPAGQLRTSPVPARVIAQGLVRRLIELHGRDVYDAHDAAARAALEEATEAEDIEALLQVRRRRPNSVWADDALFAAAELLYARGLSETDAHAPGTIGRAAGHLAELAGMSKGATRASAAVALAAIRLRAGQEIPARLTLDAVRDMPANTPVAFADIRGTLGELIARIDAGNLPAAPTEILEQPRVEPPLHQVFSVEGRDVYILRDDRFRPLRFGQSLLLVKGDRVMMVDATAPDAAGALLWSALTLIDSDELRKNSYDPPAFRLLGVKSSDERVVAVADRHSVTGIDVRSAKVLWGRTAEELGLEMFFCMAGGDGAFVAVDTAGRFVIVDVADGQVRARGQVESDKPLPAAPPQVVGGRMLLIHTDSCEAAVYDTHTGDRIAAWETGPEQTFRIIRDGEVVHQNPYRLKLGAWLLDNGHVMMVRDSIEVFDPLTPDEPVWGWSGGSGDEFHLLTATAERMVVGDHSSRPRPCLLDPRTGRRIVNYCYDTPAGVPRFAHAKAAHIEEDKVYIAHSLKDSSMQWQDDLFGQIAVSHGLAVCGYALEGDGEGKLAESRWRTVIDDDTENYYTILPLEVGREHLVVMVKQNRPGGNIKACVLSKETGEIVDSIELLDSFLGPVGSERDLYAPVREHRRRIIGPAVLMPGRLVVETAEGVGVYAGQ